MIKKFGLLAVCIAFGSPASAQSNQDNPFRAMAQKFREGHDFWQDEKFQHAFDAYFDCYEKHVSARAPSKTVTDAIFHGAYTSCAALRDQGTKVAETRIADFHPEMSADERAKDAAQYRRNLAVLRLGDTFKKIGLSDAYGDYFERTTEF